MKITKPQKIVAQSSKRFRVLVSGRRFGKTFLAIYELMRHAAKPGRRCWYVAPTYRQAKQIAWEILKHQLSAHRWARGFNETTLTAILKSGSTISLKGADKPDSLRGVGLDFLVLDEAADIKPAAWSEVLRPTLSDTGGSALFAGTPKGRNWFYDLYRTSAPDWASFRFTTVQGGMVPPEEIEAAQRDLDELTFNQEYLADFVNFHGRAYYPFEQDKHCNNSPVIKYNPRAPLVFCFDFNVSPGVALVCQENGGGTVCLAEVYIPRNSNTPAVCAKLLEIASSFTGEKHSGGVEVYGDATGGARGSAKVLGSDWDLVRQALKALNPICHIANTNPPERARINAVNARLCAADGTVRLWVDPQRCPRLVRDLEGVQLLEGGSGEIDKRANPELTHISDALGYYIAYKFPVGGREIRMQKISGV